MRTTVVLLALAAGAALAFPVHAQTTEQTAYVSVLDKAGRPVGDLDVADFVVTEDGRRREVLRAGRTSDPVDLAVIVDNSFAAEPHILDLRKALTAFVTKMADQQANLAIIGMADRPTVLVDYTSSLADMKKGIDRIFAQPGSGMVFQDTVAQTVSGLAKRANPRRAAVVVTGEGADFSNTPYQKTLDVLRTSGVAFHVIRLTNRSGAAIRDNNARDRALVIDEGPKVSGGRTHDVLSSMGYSDALARVAEDLGNTYKVVFARPGVLVPPKDVAVSVTRDGVTARGTLVRTTATGATR
jgi:VWFA-related protein